MCCESCSPCLLVLTPINFLLSHSAVAPPAAAAACCWRNSAANYKLLGVLSIINTPHIAHCTGSEAKIVRKYGTLPRNEALSGCVLEAIKTL